MTRPQEFDSHDAATVELTDGETVVGQLPASSIVNQVDAVEGTVTPTQVTYPWKAALRTGVQALIALAALFPAIVAAIGEVPAWLAPILAAAAAVAAGISRVFAIPTVNLWLARVGLSAQPKAITIDALPGSTGLPAPRELDVDDLGRPQLPDSPTT